jgi:hypothetical protein
MKTFTQKQATDQQRHSETDMTIQFDPFTAYPADELVPVTVALPQQVLVQVDDAVEDFPSVKTRERFIGFAVLFTLADIEHDAAASLDRSDSA